MCSIGFAWTVYMCELKSMLSEVLECVSEHVEHLDRIGYYNYVTQTIIPFLNYSLPRKLGYIQLLQHVL